LATKDVASDNEDKTSEPVTVVPTTTNVVNCVYCGGEHDHEECPGNPVLVNSVGSQPNWAYNPY